MKIIKLKNKKKDNNGLYKIPQNLTNRIMFMYPYDINTKDIYIFEKIKKINGIVAMCGERFKLFNIAMMGYDSMIVFSYKHENDTNPIEHEFYFGMYHVIGDIVCYIEDGEDGEDYFKLIRYLKIDKLLNVKN